jgi:hypothetical protein
VVRRRRDHGEDDVAGGVEGSAAQDEGGAALRAVLLRKGRKGRHPVDEAYGILKLGKSVDALLDEMRGPRPGKR